MRRNTAKILKLTLFVVILLFVLPIVFKQLAKDTNPPFLTADSKIRLGGGVNDPKVLKETDTADSEDSRSTGGILHHAPNSLKNAGASDKLDWHDKDAIEREERRAGIGEQGAAIILSANEEKEKDALYRVNGFNGLASDKISLNRALRDIRHPDCKTKKYLAKLPTASVVVPFHNEHWSTLLRLAHSIVNRSPPHLLHEVILADDHSNKDFLGKKLDDYLKKNFKNVRVVRQGKREGLIRTRLTGAKAATGDVLIFLDSHCEVNINWLPPLLEPIQENYKTAVCPFIDVIDFESFAYRAQDEGARGAFDWEFFYKRLPLTAEDLKHPAEPFNSPVMAGGLFAISSKFFWELGGYDPGLDIWGGEQYELSFKIWQCHGRMVDAACSRIGHIYRKFAPFPNPGIGDFVGRNYRRVAEVWMDEYKEYLYKRRPHYRQIATGDISAQIAIRDKLKCKPFKWFMTQIAFDLEKYYPVVEPPALAEGEIRNIQTNLCIDTKYKGEMQTFGLSKCIKDTPGVSGEQYFELTWHKDIRPNKRNLCFDVSQSTYKAPVILYNCHGMQGNQHFKYRINSKQLFHPISNQCLDADPGNQEIFMTPCDINKNSQQWKIEKTNATLIARANEN